MVNLNNLFKNLNDNMETIINSFIDYYGYEYKDKIISNLKRTFYHFNSLPNENYQYINDYVDEVSEDDYNYFLKEYGEFKLKEALIKKESSENLRDFVINYFELNNNEIVTRNKEKFVSLIQNYIKYPSYSKKYRKVFKKYNFDAKKIDVYFISVYNKVKKNLDDYVKKYILDNTIYGNKIKQEAKSDHFEFLKYLAFDKGSSNFKYLGDEYELHIKIPIIKLLNKKNISIDKVVIHEMIHSIESSKDKVGLCSDHHDENNIANEIKTQLITKKIVENLHSKGVYIYDSKDVQYDEKYCNYELLFIFAKIFIKYENIFKYCSINNTPCNLEILFGENWKIFSNKLDLYYKTCIKEDNDTLNVHLGEMEKLYKSMINYYENYGKYEIFNNKTLVKRKK